MDPSQTQKQQSAEETFERNKRDAIRVAREIYTAVSDPEFIKIDPVDRMKTVQEKVPEFCKAYPSVVRWMVRDLKYNELAFMDYLNMLQRDHYSDKKIEPGKGYLEYIRKQAEYSRMLYKRSVPHWDVKTANKIFRNEYDAMVKTYDEMKTEEEDLKNEFEDEKHAHQEELVDEIIDFIHGNKTSPEELSSEHLNAMREVAHLVDYRMRQADMLSKHGGEIPQELNTKSEVAVQEPEQVSEEELQKRRTRAEAEEKLKHEQLEAEKQRYENRANSFLPKSPPRSTRHKKSKNNKNRK